MVNAKKTLQQERKSKAAQEHETTRTRDKEMETGRKIKTSCNNI